jgi:hypothetical protein
VAANTTYAGKKTCVAGTPGSDQQDRRGNDGSDQANAMTNRVREFFAPRIGARLRFARRVFCGNHRHIKS